jgi:hypothetical protein
MADSNDLATALSGLNIPWTDTTYGRLSSGIMQAAPALINPYGSTGQALGIALGGLLLGELGRYQAQKTALAESLQVSDLASQMLNKPAADRTAFLNALAQQDTPTNVMSRLTKINPILLQNEIAAKAEQAAARRKLEQDVALEYVKQTGNLPAGFEVLQPLAITAPTATPTTPGMEGLNPKQQRELRQKLAEQNIIEGPKRTQDAIDKERTALTKQGENAAQISNMYNSIEELMGQDSKAADNEIARLGTKIGDPTSIVSPSEAKARISVLPTIQQYSKELEQVLKGNSILTDEARADLLKAFKVYADASKSSYTSQAELAKNRLIANKYLEATDAQINTKLLPFEFPEKTGSEKAIDRLAEISKQVKSPNITPQDRQNLITEANNLAAKYGKVWQLTRAPQAK